MMIALQITLLSSMLENKPAKSTKIQYTVYKYIVVRNPRTIQSRLQTIPTTKSDFRNGGICCRLD